MVKLIYDISSSLCKIFIGNESGPIHGAMLYRGSRTVVPNNSAIHD